MFLQMIHVLNDTHVTFHAPGTANVLVLLEVLAELYWYKYLVR